MVTFNIPLPIGWSLISLPVKPSDNSVEAVLAPIAGLYTEISTYDNPTDTNIVPTEISETMGFWINVTEATQLIVEGTIFETVTFNLYAGWNMISYPSLVEKSVGEVMPGNIQFVLRHDGNDFVIMGASDMMKPGEGYWIFSVISQEWTFDVPDYVPEGFATITEFQLTDYDSGMPITSARTGEIVVPYVVVRNDGVVSDTIFVRAKDADTEEIVGSQFNVTLNPGDDYDFDWNLTMPNKTWNLRIEAGHVED